MKRLLQVVLTLAILFAFLGIVIAQDYVGSSTCKTCHSTVYDDVFNSGHPHKLKRSKGLNRLILKELRLAYLILQQVLPGTTLPT